MTAVDTNILVYTRRQDSPHHKAAALDIKGLAEGTAPWMIPWPCIHEFLSVSTNPGIFKSPTPPEIAILQVEIWMESPTLRLLTESTGYWNHLRATFLSGKLRGALWAGVGGCGEMSLIYSILKGSGCDGAKFIENEYFMRMHWNNAGAN